jgi:tight adherence protein B
VRALAAAAAAGAVVWTASSLPAAPAPRPRRRARRRLRAPEADAGPASWVLDRGRALAGLAAPGAVDPATASRWWLQTSVVSPTVALLVAGPALAVLIAIAAGVAPVVVGCVARRRAADRLDRLVPDALGQVAASLRAGASLRGALADAAVGTAEPLGGQLAEVVAEAERGRPLRDALAGWADRAPPAASGARLAATALAIGAEAGGGIAQAVDGVAATVRERRQVQAEVAALATQARASAVLLGVAPLGFAALLSVSDPAAARFLLGTPVGLACLGAGLALEALGVAWMARITGAAR